MTRENEAFLELVRCAIHAEQPTDPELESAQWEALLRQAEVHKLLPLVLDAANGLRSLHTRRPGETVPDFRAWRDRAMAQINRQAVQENEFLNLLLELRKQGLEPLVVKGSVCRGLYPKPLLRPSVDDDLFIPAAQAPAYHAALQALGLLPDEPEADPEKAWELSYHRPNSPLYIELHKCLFDPDSPVFGGMNALFGQAFEEPCRVPVQDVELMSLAPQLHLLFLLLHAYKHFLHSGFGLRIVADLCLFTRAHGEEIDFAALRGILEQLHCDYFFAAVYRIGERYLGFPMPPALADLEADETALLADVLDAGLLGEDFDRLHTSNVILSTVAAQRGGPENKKGLRSALFPSRAYLESRYPYLRRRPWLLPVAWAQRLGTYARDALGRRDVHPTQSLRIAKDRVALLREYKIIE